jgi:pyruvate,water dikinase
MDRWIVDNEPSKRYPIYTRGNVGEVFPLPVTPLTWTWGARKCAEPGFRDALVRFGAFDADEFNPDDIEMLGCFGGYGYLNVSLNRVFGVRTPGLTPEQIDYSLWGDMPGVPPYEPQPGDESPVHTGRVQKTLEWILTATDLPELVDDQRKMAELRANRPDFAGLSDKQIIEYFRSLQPEVRRLFCTHVFISWCSTVPLGIIQGVCTELGDPTMAMRLVAGIGGVDSAAPSYAMWDLGRIAAESPELTSEFSKGVDGLLERLRASGSDDARKFVTKFDEFIYEYGSRGPNEWETSSPSWETRPELALAAIDRMRVAPPGGNPATHVDALVKDREELGAQLVAALKENPEVQGQFAAALQAAKLFNAGRERTKTTIIKLVNEARVASYELGRRMVERGIYPRKESGTMLMEEELDAFIENPEAFKDVIAERERGYMTLFTVVPPFVIAGKVPPLDTWESVDRRVDHVDPGTSLAGIPGCPGKATGRARVVLDPADPRGLEPGDVLVAPITDPAWTPLFVPASAVVVDVGAQLSHAVIVSRELGIPCVVSVTDATKKIPDGSAVTVDGTQGVVTVN